MGNKENTEFIIDISNCPLKNTSNFIPVKINAISNEGLEIDHAIIATSNNNIATFKSSDESKIEISKETLTLIVKSQGTSDIIYTDAKGKIGRRTITITDNHSQNTLVFYGSKINSGYKDIEIDEKYTQFVIVNNRLLATSKCSLQVTDKTIQSTSSEEIQYAVYDLYNSNVLYTDSVVNKSKFKISSTSNLPAEVVRYRCNCTVYAKDWSKLDIGVYDAAEWNNKPYDTSNYDNSLTTNEMELEQYKYYNDEGERILGTTSTTYSTELIDVSNWERKFKGISSQYHLGGVYISEFDSNGTHLRKSLLYMNTGKGLNGDLTLMDETVSIGITLVEHSPSDSNYKYTIEYSVKQ